MSGSPFARKVLVLGKGLSAAAGKGLLDHHRSLPLEGQNLRQAKNLISSRMD